MAVFGMYNINIPLYTYPMYLSILIAISMIQAVVSNVFIYLRLFIYINWSFYYIFSVFLKHRVGDLHGASIWRYRTTYVKKHSVI